MLWSRRGILGLGLGGVLAGCGFSPVYGPGGAAEGFGGEIIVDPPDDGAGYVLVRHLETRLGRAVAPRYRLAADIALADDGLGITTDQEITRRQIRGEVRYRLIDIATGKIVTSGLVRNFTGYSVPVFDNTRGTIAGNTVSVASAQRDAQNRLMVILADQLVARLLASAPSWRQ